MKRDVWWELDRFADDEPPPGGEHTHDCMRDSTCLDAEEGSLAIACDCACHDGEVLVVGHGGGVRVDSAPQ